MLSLELTVKPNHRSKGVCKSQNSCLYFVLLLILLICNMSTLKKNNVLNLIPGVQYMCFYFICNMTMYEKLMIPSHLGIQGNEMVDKQAKTSLSLEPTSFKISFSNF